ncbi:aspartyl protease family protein [Aquamicrobium defluvii]|uniref:Aspartyl protease n=1 Tax=Aquamicrobium defluvii TaxID=69279 RepID=A0A011UTW4_9HYPH|nr:hypothetical protein BG36_20800 [Aquamicrobium defluvii]
MTDNQETIWTKIGFDQPVDNLIQNGPTASVAIRSPDGGDVVRAVALFDTGAAGTAIGPDLANRLTLQPIDSGVIHEAGRDPLSAPFFRVQIIIPGIGSWIELDVAGLPALARPHDILIGRDFLSHFRFSVDFTEGRVALHFKNEASTT